MSKWHDAGKDDFDIDHVQREVNIFAGDDDQGNNYVTLTFKQIKALAAEIDAHYAGVSANECRHGVPLGWNCNACADSGKDPRKKE